MNIDITGALFILSLSILLQFYLVFSNAFEKDPFGSKQFM